MVPPAKGDHAPWNQSSQWEWIPRNGVTTRVRIQEYIYDVSDDKQVICQWLSYFTANLQPQLPGQTSGEDDPVDRQSERVKEEEKQQAVMPAVSESRKSAHSWMFRKHFPWLIFVPHDSSRAGQIMYEMSICRSHAASRYLVHWELSLGEFSRSLSVLYRVSRGIRYHCSLPFFG